MTGFPSLFRHNTHTRPNYRVPLLAKTHDPDCQAECLEKNTLSKMIACAQRAMRNTTRYYSGYICKRQPIGTFELKQAALNLRHLAHKISKKSNPQQYHHVANRMLGDLECRGRTSLTGEHFQLCGLQWRALLSSLASSSRPSKFARSPY